MTSRFVTARKGTPEFEALIRGTFSKQERALPTETHFVGTPEEEVTFEIMDPIQIKKPIPYWGFLGPQKLIFILFPIFYIVLRNWDSPKIQAGELEGLILSLVLSLLCVQIKVDIHDFISGYDRIREEKGRGILRQGFRTVAQLERDFKIFAILAVLVSLLPVLIKPQRVFSLVLTLILFLCGYKQGVMKNNRLLRDVALALIAGPILAYWIEPQIHLLLFGLIWGLQVYFVLQLDNFRSYLSLAQAKEKNLLTLRSFDQAPPILWSLWALSLIVYASLRLVDSHPVWYGGSVLILVVLGFRWKKSLFNVGSPAGSEIEKVVRSGYQLFYLFIALWLIEILFKAILAPPLLLWFTLR
jgi:hypothetical protein